MHLAYRRRERDGQDELRRPRKRLHEVGTITTRERYNGAGANHAKLTESDEHFEANLLAHSRVHVVQRNAYDRQNHSHGIATTRPRSRLE